MDYGMGQSSAKNDYAASQAMPERASEGLLQTAGENSKRLAIIAGRLTGISTRLCGAIPSPVATNGERAKLNPGGNGFGSRLAGHNTYLATSLDECDRALQRIEQFV